MRRMAKRAPRRASRASPETDSFTWGAWLMTSVTFTPAGGGLADRTSWTLATTCTVLADWFLSTSRPIEG